MHYRCLKSEDEPTPVVGLEELDEPADHYLLTINGSVVSGKVMLTPRDFETLAEYVDDLREQESNETRS